MPAATRNRKPANKRTRGQGRASDLPRLLGGQLCLDFANTVEGPITPEPEDFLDGYTAVVRWGWHARALNEDDLERLTRAAEADPARANAVFKQALALRQAIDGVFRAVAAGREPRDGDLTIVQRMHHEALGHGLLARDGDRFSWSWEGVADLRLPLWLVAASAVELLTEGDLARVKQCPGADDCGWLFYDTSRSGARRWCSMEGCGSRVKMRRQYARHKQRRR